jgi:hypothetical protein
MKANNKVKPQSAKLRRILATGFSIDLLLKVIINEIIRKPPFALA